MYTITVCPGCGRDSLPHLQGCRWLEGDGVVADLDRQWFEAHPEADERRRKPAFTELLNVALLEKLPSEIRWSGLVVVRRVGPGARLRDFTGLRWEVRHAAR